MLVVNQATRAATKVDCPAGIDWACVAKHPDTLKLSLDDTSTTSGFLTAAAVTAGILGRTDYASNDFEDDPFNDGLTAFANALETPGPGLTALDRVLQTAINGSATALSPVASGDIPKARAAEFATLTPAPKFSTRVVIAGSSAALAGIDTDKLTTALASTGWTIPAGAPTGVPNSGVMVALLPKWNQAIGS